MYIYTLPDNQCQIYWSDCPRDNWRKFFWIGLCSWVHKIGRGTLRWMNESVLKGKSLDIAMLFNEHRLNQDAFINRKRKYAAKISCDSLWYTHRYLLRKNKHLEKYYVGTIFDFYSHFYWINGHEWCVYVFFSSCILL